MISEMSELQPPAAEDNLEALRASVRALEASLHGRELHVSQMCGELDLFKARYRHEVGTLHEQLDELEHALAEAELGELAKELPPGTPSTQSDATTAPEPARLTSDAIRKLFREVAKTIHPDLAHDEAARSRRHDLMAAANRAYADGDEEQLRSILLSWERSPEAVLGTDPAALRLRLLRRRAQIEERLTALAVAARELRSSPVWELKAKVDEAAAQGRDLIADMVKRLKRDILVTGNRLAAMRAVVSERR
jgi:hypothetical protein